mgnify:CR=1 FL=1
MPKDNKTHHMMVRMDKEMKEEVARIAEALDTSNTSVVRMALKLFFEETKRTKVVRMAGG